MSGRMNVSSVLDLHGLLLRGNKPPELLLHVILGNNEIFPDPRLDRIVLCVVTWRMGGEPHATELLIPGLKTGQTVLFAFIKPVIASGPEQACVTEPLPFRNNTQRWIQAEGVIPCRYLTEMLTMRLIVTHRSRSRRRAAFAVRDQSYGTPRTASGSRDQRVFVISGTQEITSVEGAPCLGFPFATAPEGPSPPSSGFRLPLTVSEAPSAP